MAGFDWHNGPINRKTIVTENYKSTQKVRRFLRSQCGDRFKFDRAFMNWVKNGQPKTMGDVADEWLRRNF